MHDTAMNYLHKYSHDITGRGLDIGGRTSSDMTARALWPKIEWTVVDPLPPTDNEQHCTTYIQKTAQDYDPSPIYDLVICTEVFQHIPDWTELIKVAYRSLYKSQSLFLVTCAGPSRPSHNAYNGGRLREGEYYRNILPHRLGKSMRIVGFKAIVNNDTIACDVYAEGLLDT